MWNKIYLIKNSFWKFYEVRSVTGDFNWYSCSGSRVEVKTFLLVFKLALSILCLNTWSYESPFHNMCLWGQSLYAAYWTHGVAIFQDNRCCPTRLVSEMISVFSEKKIGINDAYKKSSLHTYVRQWIIKYGTHYNMTGQFFFRI